jgi:hypothetical protein
MRGRLERIVRPQTARLKMLKVRSLRKRFLSVEMQHVRRRATNARYDLLHGAAQKNLNIYFL